MEPNFVKYGPDSHKECLPQSVGSAIYDSLKNFKEGHKTVIVDPKNEKIINFCELCQMIAKVSINLNKLGVGKNDEVTIISENNWENVVTLLSLLMIGATTMLLNPDFTETEIRYYLSMSRSKLVCCSPKIVNNIIKLKNDCGFKEVLVLNNGVKNNFDYKVILFEELLLKVEERQVAQFLPVHLNPSESVAIITCSSGTTGLPKGVMLTSANIFNQIKYYGHPELFDLNNKQVILEYLPMFHIYGIVVLLGGLLFHSKIVVMDKFVPENFLQLIQHYKVTKLFAVPSILMFLKNTSHLDNYDLSSIQDILQSTGPVAKNVQKWVANRLNLDTIQELYGMTEVGGVVTGTSKKSKKLGSVGRIIGNHKIKISDIKTGKTLGPYEIGEICIGGSVDCIMKSYYRNEEATNEAFDSEGFVKSGDLGFYDEEDYFYLVDRIKEIIKCKGFQVSPLELERLLINHPEVKDAGVIGVPHERFGEAPLAFVVKQCNSNITEADISFYVAENISIQKHLYGGVRFIEQLPKTATGKLIRRKLRNLLESTSK